MHLARVCMHLASPIPNVYSIHKMCRVEYLAQGLKAKLTSFGIGGLTVNNETNGDPTYVGNGRAMLVRLVELFDWTVGHVCKYCVLCDIRAYAPCPPMPLVVTPT